MESIDEKNIEVKKDESEKNMDELQEKDANGIKGKNDNTEKSPEPKRAMIEPPGLVKHPIVQALPRQYFFSFFICTVDDHPSFYSFPHIFSDISSYSQYERTGSISETIQEEDVISL